MDKFGLIYFVDGTMIRRIDQNGIISTMLGSNDLTSARPLSCDSVMDISQVPEMLLNLLYSTIFNTHCPLMARQALAFFVTV